MSDSLLAVDARITTTYFLSKDHKSTVFLLAELLVDGLFRRRLGGRAAQHASARALVAAVEHVHEPLLGDDVVVAARRQHTRRRHVAERQLAAHGLLARAAYGRDAARVLFLCTSKQIHINIRSDCIERTEATPVRHFLCT